MVWTLCRLGSCTTIPSNLMFLCNFLQSPFTVWTEQYGWGIPFWCVHSLQVISASARCLKRSSFACSVHFRNIMENPPEQLRYTFVLPPHSLFLFLSLFDSLYFRLEASSICFDPHLFFSYPESIQIQTIRMIGTFPMPLKTTVSCSKSAEILVNWK